MPTNGKPDPLEYGIFAWQAYPVPKGRFYEAVEEYFSECSDDPSSAPNSIPELIEDLHAWLSAHPKTTEYVA